MDILRTVVNEMRRRYHARKANKFYQKFKKENDFDRWVRYYCLEERHRKRCEEIAGVR